MIGLKPDLIWECKNGISKIKKSNEDIIRTKINSDPLDSLRKIIEENKLKFHTTYLYRLWFIWIPWLRNDKIL